VTVVLTKLAPPACIGLRRQYAGPRLDVVDCCQPDLYDNQFDARHARDRLREYRRNGPKGSTARLIEALSRGGVDGLTVLDIGAGVGAVHQSLLAAGAASATDVDASGPYIAAAKEEAERRGLADRVRYVKGDAVRAGPDVAEADVVALDRVVCCYVDMEGLVRMASTHTRMRLGMVFPRDSAWIRAGVDLSNRWSRVRGDPFRVYVHRTDAVLAIAREAGLEPVSAHRGWFWQTLVLERAA
jgi:SAM-dependent methyltransferase